MIPFGHKNGICTRIGCPGDVGEETGHAKSAEFIHGRELAEAYLVESGKLKPKTTAEMATMVADREKAVRKEQLAAERYEREIAGIDYNGMIIKTDRESQQILDSLAEKIRRGLVAQINWKCANGWMVLDSTNIDEIEAIVLGHVQAAFAWEKQQTDAL